MTNVDLVGEAVPLLHGWTSHPMNRKFPVSLVEVIAQQDSHKVNAAAGPGIDVSLIEQLSLCDLSGITEN